MIYHYRNTFIRLLKSAHKRGSSGIYLFDEKKNSVSIHRTDFRMVVDELHIDSDNLVDYEKIYTEQVEDCFRRLNVTENYEI